MKDQAEPSRELGRGHQLPFQDKPQDKPQGPFKLWPGEGEGAGSEVRICGAGLTLRRGLLSLSLSSVCERAETEPTGAGHTRSLPLGPGGGSRAPSHM